METTPFYFPVFLTINPPHKNKVFPIVTHRTLISVIVPILILPPSALRRSFPSPRLQSDTSTCFTDQRHPLRTTVQLIIIYPALPTSLSSVSSRPSATSRHIPRTMLQFVSSIMVSFSFPSYIVLIYFLVCAHTIGYIR